jgi:MFS family permease
VRVTRKLIAKDVALIVCFTALYAVFSYFPLFRILGMPSNAITAAAITAPIIGVLLGPYIGPLSAALGGLITLFAGSFFPPSFVSGIVTALCAGLLVKGKRKLCALVYLLFLLAFGFYPFNGPAWLFPLSMWFQVIGFLILISPLGSEAEKGLKSDRRSKSILAFFATSLVSTLAGQISGSLVYTILFPPLGSWTAQWQGLTLLYPVERMIIAIGSSLVGTPLIRVLRSSNMIPVLSHERTANVPMKMHSSEGIVISSKP